MHRDLRTDRQLWGRALQGDENAFAVIYDRYAAQLLTYAFRRTASRERAEDVVSVVMLEAWRRRRDVRFGDGDRVAGWLFRTARYVLANENRSLRRHRHALARIGQLAAAPGDDVDRHLIDDQRLQSALSALGELSERDRRVLELAAWSGLTESEMAAALGLPIGTLKSRLSRARQRLAARSSPAPSFAPLRFATHQEEVR